MVEPFCLEPFCETTRSPSTSSTSPPFQEDVRPHGGWGWVAAEPWFLPIGGEVKAAGWCFFLLSKVGAWILEGTDVVASDMPLSWATLGFLCTGSFLYLLSSEKLWEKSEEGYSRLCPWECLIFVQMWPNSFCVSLPRKYDCVMSEKAKNWTIHGLWPSDIQECCPYWHLFPSDLTNLVPELNRHWPTFTNLSNFQFWEKEWRKHGTCGGCIETLNSPKKFFGAALFLRTKYNIDRAFEKAEILPSCRQSYQLRTFVGALEPHLGRQFQLQCVTDGQGRQLLVQIQVSLFSNFSTGCLTQPPMGVSPYHRCGAQGGILYVPPNQKDPRHPCP